MTTAQNEENLAMEFEAEMAEEAHEDMDDQELLQLQKKKSTPMVVIEEFVQGDNSDEDIGKPSSGLSYDSDDKTDEELVPSSSGSELIDLGALGAGDGQQRSKAAANIPKLSGPK